MINYGIIDASIKYYEKCGYKRIESPWTVTKAVSDITKPKDAEDFELKHDDNKVLVASGEQSFLYLYLKGFLPKGKFQTVTPCFRHDSFDNLHTKYFIKNEIMVTDEVTEHELNYVTANAFAFFAQYLDPKKLFIAYSHNIENSRDILYNHNDKVELGSYGIRKCDFLTWIYGTGCAEPRLTMTLQKYGNIT